MLGAFWGVAHPALGGGRVVPVGRSTGASQTLADAEALLALSILAKKAPREGPLDFPHTRSCLGPYTGGLGDPSSPVIDSSPRPHRRMVGSTRARGQWGGPKCNAGRP
uniref:Uncharacterized protein n=1 Tax=Arundo donax TaxID=35708 RepID=A0A0A9B5P8_ARUDO